MFEGQEAVDIVQSVQQEEVAKGRWEKRPLLVAKTVILKSPVRYAPEPSMESDRKRHK